MNSIKLFGLLILGFFATPATALFDPYAPGPYNETVTFHWGWESTGLYKNVEVYAPKEANGSFPVIYFSHSFAGTIAVNSVDSFLRRLASYGYTIIAPWRITSANYTVDWIDPTIDYCEENTKMYLNAAGVNPDYFPDFTKMFFIGHSAGNHIGVNYFKRKGCRNFLANIHLSPVDGTDPFGIIDGDFAITPGQILNYDIPSLVVMAGLDPVRGQPLYPPCAPENLSNTRYYNAMAGNRWFVNATDFGHADFFEPEFFDLVEWLSFCATNHDDDKTMYTDFVSGTAIAFMEAMLNPSENCEMLQYVEDPTVTVVSTIMDNDVNPTTRCQASCSWQPEPSPTSTAAPLQY